MSCYSCCVLSTVFRQGRFSNFKRLLSTATHGHEKETKIPEISTAKEKIVIPKRKKRTPVSILEALASTVGKDYTAPAYRFFDDPFLIPSDNFNKKNFTLSKSAGRKAARYLANRYKQHVIDMYDFAEPKIEAFQIKAGEYTHEDPTELALIERIEKRAVVDAMKVYQSAKSNGEEISLETIEQLLELLCLYNCEDPPTSLEREEIWYRRDIEGTDKNQQKWRTGNMAEQIFESLSEKSAKSYCTMILGYCKFNNFDKAWDLYCEMKDKKIPVSLQACNTILRNCPFCSESLDTKWNRILTVLRDIEASGLSPTQQTFNSVLFALSRMTRYRKSKNLSLQVLAEMKSCNIEPSLSMWTYIIRIWYDSDDQQSPVLEEIIKCLQDKHIEVQDPADMDFFPIAMQKCFHNLQDIDLAYKIDALLNTGENIKFLGDSSKEMNYYSSFFRLVCLMENMENIMKQYEQIAPNVWTPSLGVLDDLFKALHLHEGYEYLPLIWSDLVLIRYSRNESVIKQLTELMARKKHEPELQRRLCEVARAIKQQWIQDQSANLRNPAVLTSGIISDLIVVSLRAEDFDLAWELVDLMLQENKKIAGILSESALTDLLAECLKREEADKALVCVGLQCDQAITPNKESIEKLQKLKLTDKQRSRLNNLVPNA